MQSAKLSAVGALGLSNCGDLNEFYSYNALTLNNGVTWTNFQLAVSPGAEGVWDTTYPAACWVIKDETTYKMWYTGNSGGNLRIVYCDSTDGVNWTNFQQSLDIGSEGTYDTIQVRSPHVIKDGSTYKMWYTGRNGGGIRIIYCESSDGVNWSNFQLAIDIASQGVYDGGASWAGPVIKDGNTYKSWYSGANGANYRIIYCESIDGVNWSNFQLAIDIGSQGTLDTDSANFCSVIKDGDTYKMWYTGLTGGTWTIIYCESSNGINWSNFQESVPQSSHGTLDTSLAANPCVINVRGIGKMWYDGQGGGSRQILYCESY